MFYVRNPPDPHECTTLHNISIKLNQSFRQLLLLNNGNYCVKTRPGINQMAVSVIVYP